MKWKLLLDTDSYFLLQLSTIQCIGHYTLTYLKVYGTVPEINESNKYTMLYMFTTILYKLLKSIVSSWVDTRHVKVSWKVGNVAGIIPLPLHSEFIS